MKKFVMVILVVILVMATAMSLAEEPKTVFNNYLDCTWACDEDIKQAVLKGDHIGGDWYYYDYTLYCAYSSIDVTGLFGYIPETWNLENMMENKYEECGLKYPEVEIIRVGEDTNGETIYKVTIKTMTNLNQNFGNELGNNFIGNGKDYNWLVVLATIY